ncbi:MAG: hypothetical protein J6Y32_05350 [Bacteroidales bacterium]|nr:hypothetical protein [Bacteroidales bacterium]
MNFSSRKLLRIIWKTAAGFLLSVFLFLALTEFSPIYRFRAPEPFSGRDIFNPYRHLDTTLGWKRANFHTHTRVKGPWPVNECPYWPDSVQGAYHRLGYDIVTFSNHNELTTHPTDSTLQVNVYEHGYNFFKYHKLVFGCDKVIHFDPMLPLLPSQKQFAMEYLGRSADLIQMNHPFRTGGTSPDVMRKLSGYSIMELDSGVSTENEYWDWALSAGHYSFALANDDLHYPDCSYLIGVRCNFLNTPSGRYEDLKATLLDGCYYSMRVPDYGAGDWTVKYERNASLPFVREIGLRDSTIYLRLSAEADSIKVTGQDHRRLALACETKDLAYAMQPEDRYARFTAFFPDGAVLYSNPFARYDASVSDSPLNNAPQEVDILLSVLFNLLVAAVCALLLYLLLKVIKA